jgi:serine protease
MVFPVSVLNANGGVSQGAIQEGLTAAFGWGPDVVLIGIGADASIPEVDNLLMRMLDSTFVVAPAGNSEFPAASWPARIPGVAGVAALDDKNKRSVFSNYGEGVDLAAPGVDVKSLLGVSNAGSLRLGDIGGTSIAADIVAGVAAFLLSRTKLKPVEVLPVLRRAATGPAADGLAILDASAATDLALQVAGQL